MEPSQTSPTKAEAFAELKSALKGSKWEGWSEGIEEACRSRKYRELLGMNSHPLWNTRNIFHSIVQERDGDLKFVQQQFKLPIMQAMLETAPDKASRDLFVNQPDSVGLTPLHMAALKGHTLIARFLIDQGARLNSRDKNNMTPLHCAAGDLRADVVELLLEHLKGEDRMPYDNEFCTPADTSARKLEELEKTGKLDDRVRNAAAGIRFLLRGRQQENPSDGSMCQIMALGEMGGYECHTFKQPVSKLLDGSPPVIQAMHEHLHTNEGLGARWQSYGISLPQNKVSEYPL